MLGVETKTWLSAKLCGVAIIYLRGKVAHMTHDDGMTWSDVCGHIDLDEMLPNAVTKQSVGVMPGELQFVRCCLKQHLQRDIFHPAMLYEP